MNVQKHTKIAEFLINVLENKFKILRFRFGIDPIIGLISVVGDILPYALSLYFVYIAIISKAPATIIIKMLFYSTLDYIMGSIPLFGDAIDFFYQGHLKSYNTLKKYLDKQNKVDSIEIIKE